MNYQTLEGRIASEEISAAFNRVLEAIPTKITIYRLVQEKTGIPPDSFRKIAEQTCRTGPKKLYDCLLHLIEDLGGERDIHSTSKSLADEIMQSKDFINKSAFMDYLLSIINTKFPEVHKEGLRCFLYQKSNKIELLSWHYFTYETLRKIKEGKINVDERYLKKDFGVGAYQRLLVSTHKYLKERNNMSLGDCSKMIGQRLDLSSKTVMYHMYRRRPSGYSSNLIKHYKNLIDFVVDELFTKIDFRDENETLNSKLKRFDKMIRDGNYKDNLLVMMNPNYSEEDTVNILKVIMKLKYEMDLAGKSEFKPLFIFNAAQIGNALQQYL